MAQSSKAWSSQNTGKGKSTKHKDKEGKKESSKEKKGKPKFDENTEF